MIFFSFTKLQKPTDPYKCSPDSLGTPQYLLSRNLSTFNITCAGIIAGDETVLTEAKRLMDKHPMENVSDESISLLTKNCEVTWTGVLKTHKEFPQSLANPLRYLFYSFLWSCKSYLLNNYYASQMMQYFNLIERKQQPLKILLTEQMSS